MTTAIAPSTFVPANPPVESPTLLNLLIVDDRLVREACWEAATSLGYRATTTDLRKLGLKISERQ